MEITNKQSKEATDQNHQDSVEVTNTRYRFLESEARPYPLGHDWIDESITYIIIQLKILLSAIEFIVLNTIGHI